MKQQFLEDSREVGKVMRFAGALLGALLTVTAISHDSHNLFLLLLVLVIWPFASQVLNLYALFRGGAVGRLIRMLGHRWSPLGYVRDIVACIARWPDKGRCWFLYQIQIFNMALSVACVITYWLILTFSNVAISWSSTFCGITGLILFLLDVLALPWFFSDAAQPSMELLEVTRVERSPQCPAPDVDSTDLHWWRYVLAAHITYCLIPRSVFRLYAGHHFRSAMKTAEIIYNPKPHASIPDRLQSRWQSVLPDLSRLKNRTRRRLNWLRVLLKAAKLPDKLRAWMIASKEKAKTLGKKSPPTGT